MMAAASSVVDQMWIHMLGQSTNLHWCKLIMMLLA
jgi:hypothetical protein